MKGVVRPGTEASADAATPKSAAIDLPETLEGHWTSSEGQQMAAAYAEQPRSWLGRADLTDFQLANAVYLAGRNDLNLIVFQTAAKERIRWLSVQLAIANAKLADGALAPTTNPTPTNVSNEPKATGAR